MGAGTFPGNSPNVPFLFLFWYERRDLNRDLQIGDFWGFLRARLESPGWDSVVIVWWAFLTCSIFIEAPKKVTQKLSARKILETQEDTNESSLGDFGRRRGGVAKG